MHSGTDAVYCPETTKCYFKFIESGHSYLEADSAYRDKACLPVSTPASKDLCDKRMGNPDSKKPKKSETILCSSSAPSGLHCD